MKRRQWFRQIASIYFMQTLWKAVLDRSRQSNWRQICASIYFFMFRPSRGQTGGPSEATYCSCFPVLTTTHRALLLFAILAFKMCDLDEDFQIQTVTMRCFQRWSFEMMYACARVFVYGSRTVHANNLWQRFAICTNLGQLSRWKGGAKYSGNPVATSVHRPINRQGKLGVQHLNMSVTVTVFMVAHFKRNYINNDLAVLFSCCAFEINHAFGLVEKQWAC